jgi:enamine deaminase RidA (YjgF/YER057c/UK114 family)
VSSEEKVAALGLALPPVPTSSGKYIAAKTIGKTVYLAGAVGQDEQGKDVTGKIGEDRTIEDGYASARSCALIHLAQLRQHLGSLNSVSGIVSLTGFVSTVPGFADTPTIMNGASDLFVSVFGPAGQHVRTSVGVASLPGNGLVETHVVVSIF